MDPADVPTVTPDAVRSVADPVLLDVREQDEWDAGHAPGARHVPLGTLEAALGATPSTLPAGPTYVCICRSGNRSGRATVTLLEHGLAAVNLAGGMRAWAEAGLAVVTDAGVNGTVI